MSTPSVNVAKANRIGRPATDLLWVVGGFALLLLSALPVHQHSISAFETSVFRALNDRTVLPFVVIWPVMQLGNFLVIPITAAIAAVTRRFRLAVGILLGGVATYYLAKVVKGIVVRGRPSSLLDDVHIRGAAAGGRGFVSGHAAVVTLIALLAWPYLNRTGRIVAVVLVIVVCLSRVYVGAHLPLDVVGGVGLGLAVGGAVRLLTGRPV
jgi:membrane-associated phospholipid phosphatase